MRRSAKSFWILWSAAMAVALALLATQAFPRYERAVVLEGEAGLRDRWTGEECVFFGELCVWIDTDRTTLVLD